MIIPNVITPPERRKGFFILFIFLNVIIFNTAYASEVTGIVLDDITHRPLSEVIIVSDTQKINTDHQGHFNIETKIIPTDILFTKSGYQSYRYQIIDDNFITIHLIPIIYPSRGIDVYGQNSIKQNIIHPLKPLILSQTHIETQTSSSKIIDMLPGTSIKSYGGPAGISTVSFHGGQGNRISLMFDGIQINSEQNGIADISQIPADIIKNVQFYPQGSSSQYGSSAMTGIINITPHNNGLKFSSTYGLQNIKNNTFSWGRQIAQYSFYGSTGNYQYDGDYTFFEDGSYSSIPSHQNVRFNNFHNEIDQDHYYLNFKYLSCNELSLAISSLSVENNRNLSRSIYSDYGISNMKDRLQLQSAILKWNNFIYTFNRKNNFIHYVDTTGYPVDAKHNIDTYTQRIDVTDGNHRLSIEYKTMNNKSTDAIDTSKSIIGLFYGYGINKPHHRIILSFRNDMERHHSPVQIGELFLDWEINDIYKFISLSLSRNYKRPNFNDLYWEPFGNQHLKTEYSTNLYFRSQIELFYSTFDITLYGISYQNLIRWTPQNNAIWSPENVSAALSYGYDISWNSSTNPIFKFSIHYSRNITENHDHSIDPSHSGKPLLYTPEHLISFLYSSHYKGYTMTSNWKFYSERIRLYEIHDHVLPAYSILDISFGRYWNSKWFRIGLLTIIENVLNEQYQSIFGYPEPHRSIIIKLTIEK